MLNQNHDGDDISGSAIIGERTCVTCSSDFVITGSELEFRREHRMTLPTQCPECRARLRSNRNAEIIAIYEKAGTSDFTAGVTPAPHGSAKSAVRGQMFATVCHSCGAETRVPFVPRGDRPVYCRDCFNARRGR